MADPTLPEIRPIEGFEDYGISADGRVWRLTMAASGPARGRPLPWELRQHPYADGRLAVIVFRGGQRNRLYIAPLVLKTFVGPRPEGNVAAHNNGNYLDNRLENLRWTTQADNIADKFKHGTMARGERIGCSKLTAEAVQRIRALPRGRKLPRGTWINLSKELGVSDSALRAVHCRKTWRHIA